MIVFLKKGMNSPFVSEVKEILIKQGYWTGDTSPEFRDDLTDAVTYFQQTHNNAQGKPCLADGEVGTETWWALENPDGKAQQSGIQGKIPTGLSDDRNKILKIALSQHGIKEEPGGSNRGPGVDKYLPDFWLKNPGPPWCCYFYSWVCLQALDKYPTGKREGSCIHLYEEAKGQGLWIPRGQGYGLIPGNAFIMTRKHIGFILRVSEDEKEINTIEGNCGNRVKIGLRDIDDQISGFVVTTNTSTSTNFERGITKATNLSQDGTR